ncbi:MAG: PL29 family lyase N-terminal domain-containing protein [Candidatus Cryptobacteroides sp.]|nr:PL29 family lyase N-terminal domain-containing protein [Candidatus Cryptobacteroides sp.]
MKTTINYLGRMLCALLLCAGLAMTGCYDDSALQEQLKDHESRLKELERLTAQQNTNISSLQTIVTALQDKDYVTSVAPIYVGDEVVGYTITFSKSGPVTIYNGKDGYVPVMGVKQDESDGQWYWTVDGEWLLDSKGGKVRASAEDGEDGAPGQPGVTPTLKIVDGYWYVSYDGGKTWEEETLGQATGDNGYTMFVEVTYDEEYLYITMADGQKLVLPRSSVGQEVEGPLTWSLDKVTECSATFSGHLEVPASDLPFSQVIVYYSDAENFNINTAKSAFATSFDSEQNFTITLTGLKYGTKYNYCVLAEIKTEKIYGEIQTFRATVPIYDDQQDLNMAVATDLSSAASANCYIISDAGLYKFKTVKGNSTTSVGSVASASILWETFGTSTTPEYTDLISGFCYKDGYIAFQTADTFKEGNAVIAAKDADSNILWSWHIWLTDQPQSLVYNNNAGTMMDRNLGATSATPGDVGALGLLYQWGRKDPFLGSSSISDEITAKSTIPWPSAVSSDSSNGTIDYATANPTTYITYNSKNYDWYYTGNSSTDHTRWTTSSSDKSIYDPCPSGWRVPDGGNNGIWSKALGSSSCFEDASLYDSTNKGMNFSGKFGSASTIWYPASGFRDNEDGSLYNVGGGFYWSASPSSYYAYCLSFFNYGYVSPSREYPRANGFSVRCLQE